MSRSDVVQELQDLRTWVEALRTVRSTDRQAAIERIIAEIDRRAADRASTEATPPGAYEIDDGEHVWKFSGSTEATPPPCVFPDCVSTDRHFHGPFPGGYENPDDPDGPPIPFTSEPAPGVRDYNGALLRASTEATERPDLRWPDPNALATALYRDYDYTVTPDDIRAAYAALTGATSPSEPSPFNDDDEAAAILDDAIPADADFGEVARTEVMYSIVRALHEQGFDIAVVGAAPEEEREP